MSDDGAIRKIEESLVKFKGNYIIYICMYLSKKKKPECKSPVTQAFSARRLLSSWSSTLGVARRGSTLQKLIVSEVK